MNLAASRRGRNVLFAALYFSEGAPIGYIWWALPTKLTEAGVPVDRVTALTSLLVLPWALKFLWAPLVDGLRSTRWGFRAWITVAQIGMIATFAPLISMPLDSITTTLTTLLLAHAFFAATQDVAIDAFCINTVAEAEHGSINGWMQFGMLLGRSIFGGAIHALETRWGQQAAFLLLLVAIGVSLGLLWMSREPSPAAVTEKPGLLAFWRTLRRALSGPVIWVGLFFAATGGAAFEGLGAIVSPILKHAGGSLAEIGWFFALPVVIAIGLGAITGGYLADRFGHKRVVIAGTILLCGQVAIVAVLLMQENTDLSVLRYVLAIYYLCYGATIAATYAMLMDITEPRVGGTQFSAFMGAQNLCEFWAGRTAGTLAARNGYSNSLFVLVAISLVALLPLRWLRKHRKGTTT